MDFKPFIEFIKNSGATKEETLKLLKEETSLTPEEKNLIFLYCFPRPLADGELTKRIQSYRQKNNIINLSLAPDYNETGLIIEAAKTEQYSRFIKHLMYSFGKISKVVTVSYDYKEEKEELRKKQKEAAGDSLILLDPTSIKTKTEKCALCGRELLYYNDWIQIINQNSTDLSPLCNDIKNEQMREEFLAFGSKDSNIILCKHCLIQLINACQIINEIEPEFLDWTKRATNVSNTWDKLKIK